MNNEFSPMGTPIIRISNVNGMYVDLKKDVVYSPVKDINESFRVNYGDILIAMSGATTGKLGRYRAKEVVYLNQRVGKFVVREPAEIDYEFLWHALNDNHFQNSLGKDLATGAQPNSRF